MCKAGAAAGLERRGAEGGMRTRLCAACGVKDASPRKTAPSVAGAAAWGSEGAAMNPV